MAVDSADPIFPAMHTRFPPDQAPLLHAQFRDFAARRPLAGVSILHNVPLTLSTLLKVDCLLAAGADLTLTECVFVPSDPEAVELVKAACEVQPRLHFFSDQAAAGAAATYDIVLDTCGEATAFTTPTKGASELTLTGENVFAARSPPYPVLSVDNSRVKRVEDAIGSADGLIRSMRVNIPDDIDVDRKYVVFGFGKVGLGIAHRLQQLSPGNHVTVVDSNADARARATAAGHSLVLDATDKASVEAAVAASFCVVTCTGVKGIVSSTYDAAAFGVGGDGSGPYLANMGADIEMDFPTDSGCKLLFDGRPVNFSIKEPTTIQYLDPAFVSHNMCAERLATATLVKGVHPLPSDIDAKVLDDWKDANKDDTPLLAMVLGATSS